MTRRNRRSETGATLVVSLIMLTLITLMIIAALAIGSANFKTVTNMQFRDGAVDAANKAIDQVVSSAFALAPAAETINVDLDNNGTTDYEVQIALPVCVRATVADVTAPSSESLPPARILVPIPFLAVLLAGSAAAAVGKHNPWVRDYYGVPAFTATRPLTTTR